MESLFFIEYLISLYGLLILDKKKLVKFENSFELVTTSKFFAFSKLSCFIKFDITYKVTVNNEIKINKNNGFKFEVFNLFKPAMDKKFNFFF